MNFIEKYLRTICIAGARLIVLLLLLIPKFSSAQNDLGEVWTKKYNWANSGSAYGFIPQNDYYQTTGKVIYLITGTSAPRVGFIAEIDEKGDEQNRWYIPIPSYYDKYPVMPADFSTIPGINIPQADSYNQGFKRNYGNSITIPYDILTSTIVTGVKKADGSILAFGYVGRYAAHGWYMDNGVMKKDDTGLNGVVPGNDFSPGSSSGATRMRTGIWKIKISPTGVITSDTARGCDITTMLIYPNKVILAGVDLHETANVGNSGLTGRGQGLLHEYDLDGNFIAERCPPEIDHLPITGAVKTLSGDILLNGWLADAALIDGNTFAVKQKFSATTINAGAVSVPMAGRATVDEDFFFNPYIGTQNATGGSTFAKLNKDGTLAYKIHEEISNRISHYSNPFILNKIKEEYIGTVSISGVNKIYKLTDKHSSFDLEIGEQYPENTALKDVSLRDGFFAITTSGADNTRDVVISKLSTCANFKLASGDGDNFIISGTTFPGQAITHTGHQGTVTYSWTLTDITPGGAAITELGTSKTGNTNVLPNQTFTLATGKKSGVAQYEIIAEDNYENNGTNQVCSKTHYITISIGNESEDKLFSDDVWFFGMNNGADFNNIAIEGDAFTSRGIIFKKEGANMVAHNYSGESMVNSLENSLSVSTPACEGGFIFYAQHNTVFNAKHEPMEGDNNGVFEGHTSVADGLAAAYIGNNKYILFSVSKYTGLGELYYYIIDMNENDGFGKFIIPANNMVSATGEKVDEGIELLPKAGTSDEYWLIYLTRTTDRMKVVEINGSNANPIGNTIIDVEREQPFSDHFVLKSSKDFTKLLLVGTKGNFSLFNFNPVNGKITHKYTKTDIIGSYSGEFSPNNKYLYIAAYHGNNKVRQYDLASGTLVDEQLYTTKTSRELGGGMKLGPDNKIYIVRSESQYVAVIDNPNIKFTDPGGGVLVDGLKLEDKDGLATLGFDLGISTGLTPPWIDPDNSNKPPIAVKDEATTSKFEPITIDVLDNDYDQEDNNNTTLRVIGAWFENPADKNVKGKIEVNKVTNKVEFTPNWLHDYNKNEVIKLRYSVQDAGIPVRLCDEGILEVTIKSHSKPSSTFFSDDVWYFGNNLGVAGPVPNPADIGTMETSKGIEFKTDAHGNRYPTDASGISKVNSWENTLSVSTPACDGGFIFYTQHDVVFNSLNNKMQNGDFNGHTSTADGLAAAYINDNKYVLFSVSDDYLAPTRHLKYYIIDMNKEDGFGELITLPGNQVSSNIVTEAIELVPKVGTSDQYWLIYIAADATEKQIRVVEVSATGNIADPVKLKEVHTEEYRDYSGNTGILPKYIFNCKANSDYSQIAFTERSGRGVFHVYNFNPATGEIKFAYNHQDLQAASTGLDDDGNLYDVIFSPNGKFLYISYVGEGAIHQFEGTTLIGKKNIDAIGGGMKIGPDGKMYIARQGKSFTAVIENPDLAFTDPAMVLNVEGFAHDPKYNGLGIKLSTGLTPPWIDPENSNKPPKAVSDIIRTYNGIPASVKPLDNDTDDEALSINNISFVDLNDTIKATITYNPATEVATFKQKDSYQITATEMLKARYIVKDAGSPVQLCDEAFINILLLEVPKITLKDSCSFAPKLYVDMGYVGIYSIVWEKAKVTTPTTDADWDVITGQVSPSFPLTGLEDGKTYQYRYRIKETSSGNLSVYSKPIKLNVESYNVAGKPWFKIISTK